MRIDRLDDLGDVVPLSQPVRRVASLSPSLTEVVRSIDPRLLVGVTTEHVTSTASEVADLGDPQAPDLRLVSRLVPDVVLTSRDTNRTEDVRRLRDAGVSVWTCDVETLTQAFHSVERLVVEGLGQAVPAWWKEARQRLTTPEPHTRQRAVVLCDTDPWTLVGRNHLVTDLLAHHGVENVMASHRDRFAETTPAEIESHHVDVVVVLDDPDRPADPDVLAQQFERTPVQVLDRRTLTHFGPTLVDAARLLDASFPRSAASR